LDSPYREIKALSDVWTPPVSQLVPCLTGQLNPSAGSPPIKIKGDVSCCRTYGG
jgi:hypothetical protein